MRSAFGVDHPEAIGKADGYAASMERVQTHRRKAARNSQAANLMGAVGAGAVALPFVFPRAANKPIRALGRFGEAKVAARGIDRELRMAHAAQTTGKVATKDLKATKRSARLQRQFRQMQRRPEDAFTLASGATGLGLMAGGVGAGANSWRHPEEANSIARGWNKQAKTDGTKARMAVKPMSNNPRRITG